MKIPFKYLPADFESLASRYRTKKPVAVKITEDETFSGLKQTKILSALLKGQLPKKITRILISSNPTDEVAMLRAIQILLAFQSKNKPVNMVDLSKFDSINEYLSSISRDGSIRKYSLLVLHSILPCATEERLQLASDYIKRVNCPILIVSGGVYPSELCSDLGLAMSSIIHFEGAKQV